MISAQAICKECGFILEDPNAGPGVPCPKCGCTKRVIFDTLDSSLSATDGYRATAKRPSLPSDDKLRWDSYSGVEMCRDLGKLVRVERTIDKDADWYDECVTDPDTGAVIYECHEPLSQHRNHGTAKPPRG